MTIKILSIICLLNAPTVLPAEASGAKKKPSYLITCKEDYRGDEAEKIINKYKKTNQNKDLFYYYDSKTRPLPHDEVTLFTDPGEDLEGVAIAKVKIITVNLNIGCQYKIIALLNKVEKSATSGWAHPSYLKITPPTFIDTVASRSKMTPLKLTQTPDAFINSLYLDYEDEPSESFEKYIKDLVQSFKENYGSKIKYYPTSTKENLCGYFALIAYAKKTKQYYKIINYLEEQSIHIHSEDSLEVAKALAKDKTGSFISTTDLSALAKEIKIENLDIRSFCYNNETKDTFAEESDKKFFILNFQGSHYVLAEKATECTELRNLDPLPEAGVRSRAGAGAEVGAETKSSKGKEKKRPREEKQSRFIISEEIQFRTSLLECSSLDILGELPASGDKLDTQQKRMKAVKKTTDRFFLPPFDLADSSILDNPDFEQLCMSLDINLDIWREILKKPQEIRNWEELKSPVAETEYKPGDRVLIINTEDNTIRYKAVFLLKKDIPVFWDQKTSALLTDKQLGATKVIKDTEDSIYSIFKIFPLFTINDKFKNIFACQHESIKDCFDKESTLFDFLKFVYTNSKHKHPTNVASGEVVYYNEILQTLFISFVKMLEAARDDRICLNTTLPTHHLLQGYCPFPSWIIPLVYKIKHASPGEQIILIDDDINFGDSFVLLNTEMFKSLVEENNVTVFVLQIYDPRVYPFAEDYTGYPFAEDGDKFKGQVKAISDIFTDTDNLKFIFYDMSPERHDLYKKFTISEIFTGLLYSQGFSEGLKTHVIHLCGFDNHIEEKGFSTTNTYYLNWFTSSQRISLVELLTKFNGFYIFSLEGGYQEKTLGNLLEDTLKIILKVEKSYNLSTLTNRLRSVSAQELARIAAAAAEAKERPVKKHRT
jgi:hypothetical protein